MRSSKASLDLRCDDSWCGERADAGLIGEAKCTGGEGGLRNGGDSACRDADGDPGLGDGDEAYSKSAHMALSFSSACRLHHMELGERKIRKGAMPHRLTTYR